MFIKQNFALIFTAKFLGLLMAIFSIIIYAELHSSPWRLFLWFPITIGYSIWFSDIIESHMELKRLKYKIKQEEKKNEQESKKHKQKSKPADIDLEEEDDDEEEDTEEDEDDNSDYNDEDPKKECTFQINHGEFNDEEIYQGEKREGWNCDLTHNETRCRKEICPLWKSWHKSI
jgi:hypothetical protein